MDDETLAKIAFEAYRDYVDGARLWSDVTGREREAWEAAAGEVADAVRRETGHAGRPGALAEAVEESNKRWDGG
jgi:hypothetical protein